MLKRRRLNTAEETEEKYHGKIRDKNWETVGWMKMMKIKGINQSIKEY